MPEASAGGGALKERVGEVTFIENVSAFDSDLAARALRFGRIFGTPQAWFDAIQTYCCATGSSHGIGAHFDHSDNFVLQQCGSKEWTLAPPDHIDPSDIARRMMNVPGVGGHELPEVGCVQFTLEAGRPNVYSALLVAQRSLLF